MLWGYTKAMRGAVWPILGDSRSSHSAQVRGPCKSEGQCEIIGYLGGGVGRGVRKKKEMESIEDKLYLGHKFCPGLSVSDFCGTEI